MRGYKFVHSHSDNERQGFEKFFNSDADTRAVKNKGLENLHIAFKDEAGQEESRIQFAAAFTMIPINNVMGCFLFFMHVRV